MVNSVLNKAKNAFWNFEWRTSFSKKVKDLILLLVNGLKVESSENRKIRSRYIPVRVAKTGKSPGNP